MKRPRKQVLVDELLFPTVQIIVTLLIFWSTPWSPFWVIVTVATAAWALRSWLDSRRRRNPRDVDVSLGTEPAQAPTSSPLR